MNRRTFLGAIPLAVAGCGGSQPAPAFKPDSGPREEHRTDLEQCRVAVGSKRTTPKAEIDPLEQYPELKPLAKLAVRLHPRYGDEPKVRESKLGGEFLWPANETWPICPEFRIPMQGILQLRLDDAPPQFPIRPKADLFQLFWTPRTTKAGPPHVSGFWRTEAEVYEPFPNPGLPETADIGFVPVQCRLFPERVVEYPPVELMPKQMRERIESIPFPAARGTKAGGWPRVPGGAPKCTTCVHPMDYLLTVDSCEWTASDKVRWKPAEDPDTDGYRRAAFFNFGKPDAAVQVYLCKRCENWPLRAAIV